MGLRARRVPTFIPEHRGEKRGNDGFGEPSYMG